MISDGEYLTGLYFKEQKHMPALPLSARGISVEGNDAFTAASAWLDEYFACHVPDVAVPLSLERLEATDFRRAVWGILLAIPYGTTTTYGNVAMQAGALMGHCVSARAVGQAVGRNPVSIIIPCHRVVGADGTLTGYAGGVERKTALLAIEGT